MAVFDQRHKWGEPVREGILINRTCQVCGRTDTVETLIPDAFFDALAQNFNRPNPYRAMFVTPGEGYGHLVIDR